MRFLRIFWLPEMKSTHLFWLDGISLVKIGLEKLRFVSVEMCAEMVGIYHLLLFMLKAYRWTYRFHQQPK